MSKIEMTYTVAGLHQPSFLKLGDFDAIDAIILEWLFVALASTKMQKIIHAGREYTWINLNYLKESLPILKIKNVEVIGRRLSKMVKAGILLRCNKVIRKDNGFGRGSKSYYATGPSYDILKFQKNKNETPDFKIGQSNENIETGDFKVGRSAKTGDFKVAPDSSINIDSSINTHSLGEKEGGCELFLKIRQVFEDNQWAPSNLDKENKAIHDLIKKCSIINKKSPYEAFISRFNVFLKLRKDKSYYKKHPILPSRLNSLFDSLTGELQSSGLNDIPNINYCEKYKRPEVETPVYDECPKCHKKIKIIPGQYNTYICPHCNHNPVDVFNKFKKFSLGLGNHEKIS